MTQVFSAVLGAYPDRVQAGRAVERLLAEGVSRDAISVLLTSGEGAVEVTHERDAKDCKSEAAVISSVAVGGALGLIAGFAALAIPGASPLLAAGPLLGALAGFGAGGIAGGLMSAAGVSRTCAETCAEHLEAGGAVIAVHCHTEEEVLRAKYLLTVTEAKDVSNTGPLPE